MADVKFNVDTTKLKEITSLIELINATTKKLDSYGVKLNITVDINDMVMPIISE